MSLLTNFAEMAGVTRFRSRGAATAPFNPKTKKAFSSHGNGTLTVIKENSPTRFAVEQNVKTATGAKTLTLDSKTDRTLLIAAEYAAPAPPPPDALPEAACPPQMLPDSFSIIVVGK